MIQNHIAHQNKDTDILIASPNYNLTNHHRGITQTPKRQYITETIQGRVWRHKNGFVAALRPH